MGTDAHFGFGCSFVGIHRISIGSRAGLAKGSVFDGRGGSDIGDATIIGFQNVILTSKHSYSRTDVPIRQQGMYTRYVSIGSDVWTGCRVTILPGVVIGDHAIVGAGAVVTNSVPAYAIVVGVPARVLRMRQGTGRGAEACEEERLGGA